MVKSRERPINREHVAYLRLEDLQDELCRWVFAIMSANAKSEICDGRYIWLPVTFTDVGLEITWRDEFVL